MHSEWSDFFKYTCSCYSDEITDLLKSTEYKKICAELVKQERLLLREPNEENINLYYEITEKKAACYYEQAAIVALKHFINLVRETNII